MRNPASVTRDQDMNSRRSDGVPNNGLAGTKLLPLRARRYDPHQNDDFHNWEGCITYT